jgi:succinate dehydrogenase hydrophobic anchor subunit
MNKFILLLKSFWCNFNALLIIDSSVILSSFERIWTLILIIFINPAGMYVISLACYYFNLKLLLYIILVHICMGLYVIIDDYINDLFTNNLFKAFILLLTISYIFS